MRLRSPPILSLIGASTISFLFVNHISKGGTFFLIPKSMKIEIGPEYEAIFILMLASLLFIPTLTSIFPIFRTQQLLLLFMLNTITLHYAFLNTEIFIFEEIYSNEPFFGSISPNQLYHILRISMSIFPVQYMIFLLQNLQDSIIEAVNDDLHTIDLTEDPLEQGWRNLDRALEENQPLHAGIGVAETSNIGADSLLSDQVQETAVKDTKETEEKQEEIKEVRRLKSRTEILKERMEEEL